MIQARAAVVRGDQATAARMIERGEVAATDLYNNSTGESFLFVAAQGGHASLCSALLSAGACINQVRCTDAATPLHVAAGKGHTEVVQVLLADGAAVDLVDTNAGRTALHHAASNGRVGATELLILAGANTNWVDSRGTSPLYAAAQSGNTMTVRSLVHAGAAVNGPPSNAGPPSTAVKGIVPPKRPLSTPICVPLHAAAKFGHFEAARELLRAAADPMLCTANGQTALFIAAQQGHVKLTELLLRVGARPCRAATDGTTPLLAASAAGHVGCCQLLLRNGAPPDPLEALQFGVPSPLLAAVQKGRSSHVAVVSVLLDAGAIVGSAIMTAAHSPSIDQRLAGLLMLAGERPLITAQCRLAWVRAANVLLPSAGTTQSRWTRSLQYRCVPPPTSFIMPMCKSSRGVIRPLSMDLAWRWALQRTREDLCLAATSQRPAVVRAALAKCKLASEYYGPTLQHNLASDLAQLKASLGQLEHQEQRRKACGAFSSCCASAPSRANRPIGSVRSTVTMRQLERSASNRSRTQQK